ncbi:MAG TPA: DedA family protein [Chthonomonadaceae bacterium]|nr:DedA family protein [Chthonomonadaceae bacterium]
MEHVLSVLGHAIQSVIAAGGYAGIIVLMALESACIPLPSEIIMPFAGALTLAGGDGSRAPLNFHLVALSGAVGCALGSSLAYWVGATGGREMVFRYGRYVLLRRHDVERAEAWFQRWGAAAVFVARLLPIIRTFISLPAGIARMPFVPFLTLSFLGSVPWCYLLAYIGVQFASHLDDLKRYFHGADAIILLLLLIGFGFWLRHHLRPDVPQET